MPICFQYIDFVIGIFGLFISLFTLYATFNVRKRIIHNAEYSDFYNSIDEITDKLQADINSINDDRLRNPKFVTLLSQELTDIETRFTFLSPKAKRPILK